MTLVVLIYWPPPSKVEIAISGVARIVLSDVFFASIFVAYEIKPGFETGPNGYHNLVCKSKLDKYLKMY
jgi:hypothetical protein